MGRITYSPYRLSISRCCPGSIGVMRRVPKAAQIAQYAQQEGQSTCGRVGIVQGHNTKPGSNNPSEFSDRGGRVRLDGQNGFLGDHPLVRLPVLVFVV